MWLRKYESENLTATPSHVLNYPHGPPQPSCLRLQYTTSVSALWPPARLLALSASVKCDLASVCSHDVSSRLVDTEPTSNKRELFSWLGLGFVWPPSAAFLHERSTSSSPVYICLVSFLSSWELVCQKLISPGEGNNVAFSLQPSGAFNIKTCPC